MYGEESVALYRETNKKMATHPEDRERRLRQVRNIRTVMRTGWR
jgi:hypothetical protein